MNEKTRKALWLILFFVAVLVACGGVVVFLSGCASTDPRLAEAELATLAQKSGSEAAKAEFAAWESRQTEREAAVERGEMSEEKKNEIGWEELLGISGGLTAVGLYLLKRYIWAVRGSPEARKGPVPPSIPA